LPAPGLKPVRYLARFECKYFVDPLVLPELRQMILTFAAPDRFAAPRPGYRYPISSLYLDTEDLRFYHQTVGGVKNRFKLRLRTYDDDPGSLVFLEIKERMNAIVKKWRLTVTREQADQFLEGGSGWLRGSAASLLAEVDPFGNRLAVSSARPFMRVRYVREAYETREGSPVRITFDTDLAHAVTLDRNLAHGGGGWVETPLDGVILEIKFTERYPEWVADLVRMLGLVQQSIPKYVLCIDDLVANGGGSAVSVAGFCLPPHWA
jgi:hypothetical protein